MVGEIRDLETAEIAIQAALTGHLVFSTLHTNDAPGAVTRLQDMGVEPYLLSSVLERRAGPAARAPHLRRPAARPTQPDPAELLAIGVTDAGGRGAVPRQGLRRVPRHRLSRPHRASTSCSAITEESRSLIVRKAPAGEIRRHAVEQRHGRRCGTTAGPRPARASPRSRRSCASPRKTTLAHGRLRLPGGGSAGQTIDGVMEAPDARARRRAPAARRLLPHQDRAPGRSGAASSASAWPALGGRRVAGRDLVSPSPSSSPPCSRRACRSTARSPSRTSWRPTARLRAIMADVLRSVRGGTSLGEALAKHHPRPFSRLYINMVRAGEKGGVLEATLRRLAEFLEESQEFRDALVSALIYPVLLTGVGAAAVVFLHDLRHPALRRPSSRTSARPFPCRPDPPLGERGAPALLVAARRSRGAGAACSASRMVLATPRGRLAGRSPAPAAAGRWAQVIVKTEVARFTRILGTLLQSGVPMLGGPRRGQGDDGQPGAGAARWSGLGDGVAARRRPRPADGRARASSRRWPSTWCGSARRRAGSRRCCSRWPRPSRPTRASSSSA